MEAQKLPEQEVQVQTNESQKTKTVNVAGEDVVLDLDYPHFDKSDLELREWTAPNYSNQQDKTGYEGFEFKIQKNMEKRVAFWVDIYSKFSSWQGVLHDSIYLNDIYSIVDFSEIMQNENLSHSQKRKERKKLLKSEKKRLQAIFAKLQKVQDSKELNPEELKIYNMIIARNESNSFKLSGQEGRLRFQLGQRDYFLKGIYNSGLYFEEMEEIFESHNLPKELTRLVFVESSFNLQARSKVGASGLWQFMRSTGRRYLKIKGLVDYRNDPIAATHAAAKLLKTNYNMLEEWPLAITAYNFGASGIKKLTLKHKSTDIGYLANNFRHKRWGFASSNFYASFLAALYVEKNANKYFENVKTRTKFTYDKYVINKRISYEQLLSVFNNDREKLIFYNPHFYHRRYKKFYSVHKGNTIYLPKDNAAAMVASLEALPKPKYNIGFEKYVVSRGDTLSHISVQFGVSVRSIMDENGMNSAKRLRAGQVLRVPVSKSN